MALAGEASKTTLGAIICGRCESGMVDAGVKSVSACIYASMYVCTLCVRKDVL